MMPHISDYVLFNFIAAFVLVINSLYVLSQNGISIKSRFVLIISMSLAFLVGARLLYAVLYLDKIISEPGKLFEFKLVNFSLYGGLILSLCVFGIYIKSAKINGYLITDAMMPALSVALMFSKLGCFFNGCCYGVPTNMPWGVVFEHADGNAVTKLLGASPLIKLISGVNQVPRHPTQLYEAGFAIFAGLVSLMILLLQQRSKRKRYHLLEVENETIESKGSGIATLSFILIYTIGRWISFYFRDFPQATATSDFIRGPLIYGTIISITVVMLLLKIKQFSKDA